MKNSIMSCDNITTETMMSIKARQEDYWNKIAQYNQKIFQLEKQEAALKKKKDQANFTKYLNEQVDTKNHM